MDDTPMPAPHQDQPQKAITGSIRWHAVDLPLTVDQLDEGHLLLLGTTGAGKTYQLRGMIEQLRRAGRRVGAIDKLGNHWGLTLSADGQRPGLDFVIFGGKRAHVPMRPNQGEQLGRLFVERNVPAIFDVSQWKADDQLEWIEGFADAVFLANEGALHLAIDEAQSWVPQGGGGPAFNSVRRLAEQGRGNGIRLMLACQRWSRLDASVRGMADSLIVAMRQTSPVDRKAIAELVAIDRAQRTEIEEALPLLKAGEAFVWEPREARVRRVNFPLNSTFDSSRTPRHGDAPPPPIAVSGELVDALRAALAPAEADVKQEGSVCESAQVADLIRANAECADMIAAQLDEIAVLENELEWMRAASNRIYRLGVETGLVRARRALLDLQVVEDEALPLNQKTVLDLDCESQAKTGVDASPQAERGGVEPVSRAVAGRSATAMAERMAVTAGETAPAPPPPVSVLGQASGVPPLNRTARDAAALLRAIPKGCGLAWDDILLLLCRRPNSGDSHAARKALIANGLIEMTSNRIEGTPTLFTRHDLGKLEFPAPRQLLADWAVKLRGPGGDMLVALFDHGDCTPAELARRLDRSPKSGWWGKGLKDLRGSNLVSDENGHLVLHHFFREGGND